MNRVLGCSSFYQLLLPRSSSPGGVSAFNNLFNFMLGC